MVKKIALLMAFSLYLLGCNNDDENKKENKDIKKAGTLGEYFNEVSLPYSLSDTALQRNTNGEPLQPEIASLISSTATEAYFGRKASPKFTPIAKLGKENYYLVKATSSSKKAAFVLVSDKENNSIVAYPFLLPDANSSTTQTTTIDKKYIITKNIVQRNGSDIVGEGKEVVAWDPSQKSFSIIMTDALNSPDEVANPIDTFSKSHKLAGDYYLNKKNFVAVRDGRYANQLLVYIHTQNEAGDCRGELKGEFLLTSANSATYRLGGDPCVLNLSFSGNKVSIKEESGCGNHRDLDCPLSGTFTRKKPAVPKQPLKNDKRK